MALFFALSSLHITLNLSRCFSNYTSEQQIRLCQGYTSYRVDVYMYTEHHSVVSFFMESMISNSFLCFTGTNCSIYISFVDL